MVPQQVSEHGQTQESHVGGGALDACERVVRLATEDTETDVVLSTALDEVEEQSVPEHVVLVRVYVIGKQRLWFDGLTPAARSDPVITDEVPDEPCSQAVHTDLVHKPTITLYCHL